VVDGVFPKEKPEKVVVVGTVVEIFGFSAVVFEAPPNLISVVGLEGLEPPKVKDGALPSVKVLLLSEVVVRLEGLEPPKVKDGALLSVIKVLSLSEAVDKVEVLAPNENVGATEVFSFSKGFSISVGLLIFVKVNPTVVGF